MSQELNRVASNELRPRVLGREETARQLGVSLRTVCRLLENGTFKAVRIGTRCLISTESIDAFIARGGETTNPADTKK